MKAIILALLVSAISLSVSAEETEHNYKLKHDDWQFTYRHREGTWHTELGNDVGPINVMYRYAELDGTHENRIKFTHNIFKYKNIKFGHRIEYRYFNNQDSHWRYRFMLEAKQEIVDDIYLWTKIQPRWSFKNSETEFDTRDQLGIQIVRGKLKFTPFIERGAQENYNHKYVLLGTYFEYTL